MDYKLVIDSRERKLISILNNCNHPVETKNLDIGDIQIVSNEDDTVVACFERKTVTDIAASIKDGRYREQKLRLMAMSCAVKGYIVEDSIPIFNDAGGVSSSTIRSAIMNTIVRDKLCVFQSSSTYETYLWCVKLIEKCGEQRWDEITEMSEQPRYTEVVSTVKKKNMTPENCFITQLKVMPGISDSAAGAISREFCSFRDIYDNLHNKTESERKTVFEGLVTEKKRKLGPKVAETLNRYLFEK
jgi:ERCC4-type nuclease